MVLIVSQPLLLRLQRYYIFFYWQKKCCYLSSYRFQTKLNFRLRKPLNHSTPKQEILLSLQNHVALRSWIYNSHLCFKLQCKNTKLFQFGYPVIWPIGTKHQFSSCKKTYTPEIIWFKNHFRPASAWLWGPHIGFICFLIYL